MAKESNDKHPNYYPEGKPPDKPATPYEYTPAPVEPEPPATTTVTSSYLPVPSILNNTEPPRTNQSAIVAGKIGDAEPYIFGRCIADPVIISADDTGRFLYVDMLWSVGEIERVEYMLVNNNYAGLAGPGETGSGKVQHFEGTSSQAASSIMVDLKGEYDLLLNKAHTVIPLIVGEGVIEKAMVQGLKLEDPRTSPHTVAYSTNPALALARLFVDCGFTINWASVANVANYNDELLGVTSPQVKRWEIGGQIKVKKDISEWAHVLAQYANCFLDVQGGEVTLTADEPRSSNHTVTADDMVEGTVKLIHPRGSQVPDAVTVIGKKAGLRTDDPTGHNQRISYTYGTSSGAGTESTINMPWYQTVHACGRKAEEIYRKSRMRTLEFVGFDDGLKRTIGDLGSISNAQYGLSSDLFALVEMRQVAPGRSFRRYVEYDASNYSDVIYSEDDIPVPPGQNPSEIPTGPCPTVTEELVEVAGVIQSRFKITFTGIEWPYLKNYYVTASANGETWFDQFFKTYILRTDLDNLGVTTHTTYTTGAVDSGKTYTIKVYVRSNSNDLGDPCSVEITAGLAPSAQLSYGDLTNMHVYILDGDARYATSSNGVTWENRFTSSPLGAWTAGETWLGDQIFESTFETEVWNSGNTWDGLWKFTDLGISTLGGATRGNFVALSADASPLSFTEYAGTSKSGEAQWMKAKCVVTDSPLSAGGGLHVKLPVPVSFTLGG